MTFPRFIFRLLPILLLMTSCLGFEQADLIVHNARIYSVDENFTIHQAMAIRDGKIVEIGPEHQIMNKYHASEVLDAQKRPVYPGFIDAHCHFYGYGKSLVEVNLLGCKSYQEMLDRLENYGKNSSSEWITGRGWDHTLWPDQQFPDKTELDRLFPNRPVAVQRVDGHAGLVNQAALDRAGITLETQIEGGQIEVKNGELTGILIDNAFSLVDNVIPAPTEAFSSKALLDAQKNCFEVGLTTVTDAGLEKGIVDLIQKLHDQGDLKMKVCAMLSDTKENLDHYLESGPVITDRLTARSFKFYADGALGSRGACLLEPYADSADFYGTMLHDVAYFKKYARQIAKKGFQMNTHCIGDSAVRTMIKVYAEATEGNSDHRWRIEHSQVVHPDDFALFGKHTIIPSVQPTHATSDMRWAGHRLGDDRVKSAYAYKKLLQQNQMIPLGTDFPVEKINPLYTFISAVARTTPEGFPLDGFQTENALSREEALKGMTIWAALANFEEEFKGSLEPGKSADFVILSQDIMKVPLEKVSEIKVRHTFINGEKVYGK